MNEVLRKLAKNLNDADILWGIGGSLVLKAYGIVDQVHDIDLLVSKGDIEKAIMLLDKIANRKSVPVKKEYKSKHFYVYEMDGISIDLMSSFRISHRAGIYEFILDDRSITKKVMVGDFFLPYTSLEDWFVAYSLMIGRDKKVKLIKDYLMDNGIGYPELLKRNLNQALPEEIRNAIDSMLDNT